MTHPRRLSPRFIALKYRKLILGFIGNVASTNISTVSLPTFSSSLWSPTARASPLTAPQPSTPPVSRPGTPPGQAPFPLYSPNPPVQPGWHIGSSRRVLDFSWGSHLNICIVLPMSCGIGLTHYRPHPIRRALHQRPALLLPARPPGYQAHPLRLHPGCQVAQPHLGQPAPKDARVELLRTS